MVHRGGGFVAEERHAGKTTTTTASTCVVGIHSRRVEGAEVDCGDGGEGGMIELRRLRPGEARVSEPAKRTRVTYADEMLPEGRTRKTRPTMRNDDSVSTAAMKVRRRRGLGGDDGPPSRGEEVF